MQDDAPPLPPEDDAADPPPLPPGSVGPYLYNMGQYPSGAHSVSMLSHPLGLSLAGRWMLLHAGLLLHLMHMVAPASWHQAIEKH